MTNKNNQKSVITVISAAITNPSETIQTEAPIAADYMKQLRKIFTDIKSTYPELSLVFCKKNKKLKTQSIGSIDAAIISRPIIQEGSVV